MMEGGTDWLALCSYWTGLLYAKSTFLGMESNASKDVWCRNLKEMVVSGAVTIKGSAHSKQGLADRRGTTGLLPQHCPRCLFILAQGELVNQGLFVNPPEMKSS